MQSNAERANATVGLLAASVWIGGLVVLGVVVAPTVFRNVPAPASADAMILVFRRFDSIAMSAAALIVACEAWRAVSWRSSGKHVRAIDVVRIVVAVIAAGLAVWQGVFISPNIAALHAAGAIRGWNAAGIELESLHKIAEGEAKAQLGMLAAWIALRVYSMKTPRDV